MQVKKQKLIHAAVIAAISLAGVAVAPSALAADAKPAGSNTRRLSELRGDSSNDQLLYALNRYDVKPLLEHAYKKFGITDDQKLQFEFMSALKDLNDPAKAGNLTASEREAKVAAVAQGIDKVIARSTNVNQTLDTAKALLLQGVKPDLNTLEYWGRDRNDTATPQRLRVVADAVHKLYEKAAEQADKQADALSNKNAKPEDIEAMENLLLIARYSDARNDYARVLGMDPANRDAIDEICKKNIEYLSQFDTPARPEAFLADLKIPIAKFAMMNGNFDLADRQFNEAVKLADKAKAQTSSYESRYFHAVSTVLAAAQQKGAAGAKLIESARAQQKELETWQAANIPDSDKDWLKGAQAAGRMLEYRIALTDGEISHDPRAMQNATDVLLKLVEEQPHLKSVVFGKVLAGLPRDASAVKVAEQNPLVLHALTLRGQQTINNAPDEKAIATPENQQLITLAYRAEAELLKRGPKAGLDAAAIDEAAYNLVSFLHYGEQPKKEVEAALDYLKSYGADADRRKTCFETAQWILYGSKHNFAHDKAADSANLVDEFLELAMSPKLNDGWTGSGPSPRQQYSFEYGQRLVVNTSLALENPPKQEAARNELLGRINQSIKLLSSLPETDKRNIYARYFELLAHTQRLQLLAEKAPEHGESVSRIQVLAQQVKDACDAAIKAGGEPDTIRGLKVMSIRTAITAAELAVKEKNAEGKTNPQVAIDLLKTFEDDAKGIEHADELVTDAIQVRFQAYVALDRRDDAVAELTRLQQAGGDQAIRIITSFLEKLDKQFDAAMKAKDTKAAAIIAANEAQATEALRGAAEKSGNKAVKDQLPQYILLNARTNMKAAELSNDAKQRTDLIDRALVDFRKLWDDPEQQKRIQANPNDPMGLQLRRAFANAYYVQGNYKLAELNFQELIKSNALGLPFISSLDPKTNQPIEQENKVYWEIHYKRIRSLVEIGKGPEGDTAAMDAAKQSLRQLFVLWEGKTGGSAYHDEYVALQKEILPDFKI